MIKEKQEITTLVDSMLDEVRFKILSQKKENYFQLVIILVGDNPASLIYVNNKIKICNAVGIETNLIVFKDPPSKDILIDIIEKYNVDPITIGIMVQLPLPSNLDEIEILSKIVPHKDVDGLTPYNRGLLGTGREYFAPCTPSGVIHLLNSKNITLKGKNCVIIGRSDIVGKPLSTMLLSENAIVTVCHSHTETLKDICKQADIIFIAIGKPKYLTNEYIKPGCIIIDIGINRDSITNKICGDVDYDDCIDNAEYISPVPGGIGRLTVAMLMKNCSKFI